MHLVQRIVLPALLLVALSSCDSVPGSKPINTPAPAVSDFLYSPTFFDLSQVSPGDTVGGVVRLPVEASVSVADDDQNLTSVEVLVRSPLANQPIVLQEPLTQTSSTTFDLDTELELPVGAVGLYTILVFAVDSDGNISNQVRGLISFGSSQPFGTPPVVELVEAFPEIVNPPATLKMVATVSDAEGLSNILRVEISTESLQGLQMFDDGESLGDDVANDGRFTASFDVPSGQPADTTTFFVQAFDRNGLSSDIVSKDVRVE